MIKSNSQGPYIKEPGSSRGQVLIVVLGILVIFMIMIPVLISLVQNESRWSVKNKKTSMAFHAAEAGLDRGIWKLNEKTSNWDNIISSGSIDGYTGQKVYDMYLGSSTDKVIGQYKVNIMPGDIPSQIKVVSIGRDPSSSEVRGLEVVYSKNAILSSINTDGGISWKPNLEVHWGPVVTYTSIDQAPSKWYPRKISKGQIVGRDTDPQRPNDDGKEFWAFQDLGDPPRVQTSYYLDLAKKSRIKASLGGLNEIRKKTGSSVAVADPVGSGYFPAASNSGGIRINKAYMFANSTSVIYTDGTLDLAAESFLDLQAVIAEQNVDFNGSGHDYTATVPVNAAKEYVKQKEMVPGYTYPGEGSATYTVTACGMHGFLYCGGSLNNAGGNAKMVGAIKVLGNVTLNTMTVYYDEQTVTNIKLSNTQKTQVSWREIGASW